MREQYTERLVLPNEAGQSGLMHSFILDCIDQNCILNSDRYKLEGADSFHESMGDRTTVKEKWNEHLQELKKSTSQRPSLHIYADIMILEYYFANGYLKKTCFDLLDRLKKVGSVRSPETFRSRIRLKLKDPVTDLLTKGHTLIRYLNCRTLDSMWEVFMVNGVLTCIEIDTSTIDKMDKTAIEYTVQKKSMELNFFVWVSNW